MRVVKTTLVLLALALSTGTAAAQSTNGTILGRVVDPQGGVLPGVTVEARSAALPAVRTTVTLEGGDYALPLLPPGVYQVTFTLSNFEQAERSISVAPTQVVPLDVTLGLTGIRDTVTV
ncbi:MAG: carboxypeptidase-like regulatory domain-containing protein, partial [Vicinamibacterales bacterium]